MFSLFKKLISTLVIVSFFSIYSAAFAAPNSEDNGNTIGTCVAAAIASGFATSLGGDLTPGTSASQTAVETAVAAATASNGAVATAAGVETAVSVPVADAISNIYLGTTNGVLAASSAFQDIGKMNLDKLAYSTAQCTLDVLTQNTINWIQNGFEGGPGYAINTRTLIEDIAKGVSADFANQIRNLQVCDFTPNFVNDLANRIDNTPQLVKLPPQIQCPFPSQNVSATQFYKDFSVMGWKGMSAMLDDSGNPFGIGLVTGDELAFRQATAKAASDQKLSWSNGFVDMIDTKDCQYPLSVKDMMSKNPPADTDGNELSSEAVSFYQKTYCKTITPGSVVASSLMKVVGAKQDRIGFADNMNKIISALITKLSSDAVTGIFKAANNATPASGPSHNPSTIIPYSIYGITSYVQTGTAVYSPQAGTAILSGSVYYATLPGQIWFEWGTSPASLTQGTASYSYSGGVSTPSYSAEIKGLLSNKTYYYEMVGIPQKQLGQTSVGSEWRGGTQSFTTTSSGGTTI